MSVGTLKIYRNQLKLRWNSKSIKIDFFFLQISLYRLRCMWQNCHFFPHLPLCLSALSVLPAPTLKTKMAARAGLLQRPFWLPQMGAGGLSAAFPGASICCSKSDGSPATEKKKVGIRIILIIRGVWLRNRTHDNKTAEFTPWGN